MGADGVLTYVQWGGPAFNAEPMFSAGRKVLGALGLKKGGLAVMPRGKGKC